LPEYLLPVGHTSRESALEVRERAIEDGGHETRGGDQQPESTDLHVVKLSVGDVRGRGSAASGARPAANGSDDRRVVR
jgi:hypothetical protein